MGAAAVAAAQRADAGAAITASLATAGTGGWCTFLGKPAGSTLTREDAGRIAAYVFAAIDNGAGIQFVNPLWQIVANGAKQAIAQRLAEWVAQGATCDQIPNNLATDPKIDAAIPDRPGEVVGPALGGLLQVALDWTGLGDLVIRGGILIGILVLLLMAIRRVLR